MTEAKKIVVCSLPLGAFVLAYAFRPAALYAVTIWPAWIFAFVGLVVSLLVLRRARWVMRGPVLAGWLLFAFGFSEEWRPLVRFGSPAGRLLRVVSLNCAGGDPSAAMEVVAQKPDIVLLQETPDARALSRLALALFGEEGRVFSGPDGAVIVRGGGERAFTEINATGVWWDGPLGRVLIVSARFAPPLFRLDYWNPDCWSSYAENKRLRREEVVEVASRLAPGSAVIFGGDFNSPPDDSIFGPLLDKGLTDSFASAGRGWGATAINSFPLLRIDQIWLSEGIVPARVYSVRTVNSDHQMVVCDVVVKQ